MKLWQKVFLLSLLFMTTAVQLAAYLILQKNFSMSVERELSQAVYEYEAYAAGISGSVMLKKLQTGKIALNRAELFTLLKALPPQSSAAGMAVCCGDETISSYAADMFAEKFELLKAAPNIDACTTLIFDAGDSTYIAVGAVMKLEQEQITFLTAKDISDLYDSYQLQLRYVRLIGIVSACVFAALLLVMVLVLLAPLSAVNRTLKEISGGNYTLRLKVKGGRELRELTENVNEMVNAVEENAARLQSLADSRKRFVENLAHEMKTPLTSIIGFADILRVKRHVAEPERIEYAHAVVEEAKRLRGLSGKLLELSAAANLTLEQEELRVSTLFEDIAAAFPFFAQKQIQLTLAIENDAVIKADKELFRSLLYNLLDNAVKASRNGQEIRLGCKAAKDAVVLYVSDDGIGMDADAVKKAAEPFYMADKSRSRKSGGVGLGLSLCIEIAKKHRAELRIESEPGAGTTVSIVMPLEVTE